jgi:UDP-N-acetylmuramate dehydrogenase
MAKPRNFEEVMPKTSAAIKGMEEDGVTITAYAGVSLARLADFACKQGLTGLEFAHGIPGTLGAAVCMNAGAYGGEMKQVIESVTLYFPGEGVRTLSCEEMEFSYRHSLLSDRPEVVVLAAAFRLKGGDPAAIREKMRELLARRKATQPLEFPSAGSTFKRPVGNFAGTLVEQCGLKGLTVGGARVSEKHAGFLINPGGATCKDVTDLIALVQERVMEAKGVHLEPEVKIIRA